jgi:hypothetical protein
MKRKHASLIVALSVVVVASTVMVGRAQQQGPPAGARRPAPAAAGKGSGRPADSAARRPATPGGRPPTAPRTLYGSAIGAQGGKIAHGVRTVDIRDYGAVPDGPGGPVRDNAPAIQAAIDAAVGPAAVASGRGNGTPVVVKVPSGNYWCGSPVFVDYDRVTLVGEGPSTQIHTGNGNYPPVIAAIKRREPYKTASPQQAAGLSTDFSSQTHRVSLDGQFDPSVTGTGRYYLLSKAQGSTSPSADHWLYWQNTPPCYGKKDYWNGDGSREFTLQIAVKNPGGGALNHGYICGFGDDSGGPGTPAVWQLWCSDAGGNGDQLFYFYFYTPEGGRNNQSAARVFGFGDPTAAGADANGWYHLTVYVNLGANDGSGMCALAAWQNGTQRTIGRNYGTQRTTPTGTPGNAGYEPSFTAADNLHWQENWYWPLSVFAQSSRPTYPYGGDAKITNRALGGLRMDLGACPFQIGAVGSTQKLAATGVAPTMRQKYFDGSVSTGTLLMLLSLDDPPHDAAKTSDRLITTWFNGGGSAGGYKGFGWFAYNESDDSAANVATDIAFQDISLSTYQGYGVGLQCGNAFMLRLLNVSLNPAGTGWHGLDMGYGGYDYKARNLTATGADAAIYGASCMFELDTMQRVQLGRTLLRFSNSNVRLANIKTGDINSFGMTSESIISLHGNGGYAGNYEIDTLETDNESTAGPKRAVIYAERSIGLNQTQLVVRGVTTGNLGGAPVVMLADNGGIDLAHAYGPGFADISRIVSSDGFLVQTNGPAWRGKVRDSLTTDFFLTGGFGSEFVRNTGPGGVGNVVVFAEADALPTAGKFAAGSVRLTIRNPQPGQPLEYLCTGTGTAGSSSPPTWKAISTVAP